jgi:hypothetical protein
LEGWDVIVGADAELVFEVGVETAATGSAELWQPKT